MKTKITEALKLAIEFEKEGREYFLSAAEKASHPLGKKMFLSLAKDEVTHLKQVTELYQTIGVEGSWPEKLPESCSEIKTIFAEALKNIDQAVKGNENDLAVLDEAMKLERKGNAFYHDLYRKAEDKQEKAFFEALAKEEADHYEILKNTKTYLESPADYYQEEEHPLFEG